MRILVRLPNWLGDMVMSLGFIHQLRVFYPQALISVIAKKGIDELLPFFPETEHRFIFSKNEYPGMKGLWRFGREIKNKQTFDLFFCLPNSFSSALMGYATGAKIRIGFKNEARNILLSKAYHQPLHIHRVEEYVRLLELYSGKNAGEVNVQLHHQFAKQDYIVVNINSEASSRRLTEDKAVEVLNSIRKAVTQKIVLIGAPKEQQFVESVLSRLNDRSGIESVAGKTSLSALIKLLASARLMLTTDSGPAHLANALSTHTLVLFGAGNEHHTAPYRKDFKTIFRLGELSCEPCEKNTCVRYGVPQCLERLDTSKIVDLIKQHI